MQEPTLTSPTGNDLDPGTSRFYRQVLEALSAATLPFLIGGAYAFNCYTEVNRPTRDLDIFIRRRDFERASEALRNVGYRTELVYPHWLGKAHFDGEFIDIIFSSGNGISEVDDAWFDHAEEADVLGISAKICPVEEMIWSKAFIMERERYDGADVVHLLQARADKLDWKRLLDRFGPHWRVLLSHLVLFGFIYPADRDRIPAWLMDDLLDRLQREMQAPPPQEGICYGTLLSREQYLGDLRRSGCRDARLTAASSMTARETAIWTEAIQKKGEEH
jgi:hypothetical protein